MLEILFFLPFITDPFQEQVCGVFLALRLSMYTCHVDDIISAVQSEKALDMRNGKHITKWYSTIFYNLIGSWSIEPYKGKYHFAPILYCNLFNLGGKR